MWPDLKETILMTLGWKKCLMGQDAQCRSREEKGVISVNGVDSLSLFILVILLLLFFYGHAARHVGF